MILTAIFLASTPMLDQRRCVAAYRIVEQRVAEFHWIVNRAERKQRFSPEQARAFRLRATIVVRPYRDELREIASYADGEECEELSRDAIDVFVDEVVRPYRDFVREDR